METKPALAGRRRCGLWDMEMGWKQRPSRGPAARSKKCLHRTRRTSRLLGQNWVIGRDICGAERTFLWAHLGLADILVVGPDDDFSSKKRIFERENSSVVGSPFPSR